MTGPELYAKHLADFPKEAAARFSNGHATTQDFIAMAEWEAWEAVMSLPPMSCGADATRVTDTFHASACAARCSTYLRLLKEIV